MTQLRTATFAHSLLLYDSDDEWERALVTFLSGAEPVGEVPVAIVMPERVAAAEAALAGLPGVSVAAADPSITAATSLRLRRDLMAENRRAGHARVRLFSEVPGPATGACTDEWARYETGANIALADLSLRAVCAYARDRTPDGYVDLLERSHPRMLTATAQEVDNARYEPAASLWRTLPRPQDDPLEHEPPDLSLDAPTPTSARVAVSAAVDAVLDRRQHDDLLVAVSEVVTNAVVHGRPPVQLRLWVAPGRVVVTVHDHGQGPQHIGVGLWPAHGAVEADGATPGGLGLWLAHQLVHVVHRRDDDGHTVRLTTRRHAA